MTTLKSLRLDPRSFPVVLPHISCFRNQVYFGGKYITSLMPAEAEFLKSCGGMRTLAEIVNDTGTDARCAAHLARWFVWWDRAISEAPEASEAIERLVLTAGPEDAWFGMGGRLLLEAPQTSTMVLTCFGTLTGTRYREVFRTPDEVSTICRDEAALAARLAHVRQQVWGIPEQDVRYWGGSNHASEQEALAAILRGIIIDVLGKYRPRQIFIPTATRLFSDAKLLFEILLSLFVEGRLKADLHIYEDAPAANGHRPVDEFLSRFESSYIAPEEYFVDVTECIHRKFSLLEVFRCRFNRLGRDAWERSARRNALLAGFSGQRFVERFWKVGVAGLN